MRTVTKRASVEKAYGQELDSPVEFSYDYEELQTGDEIPAKEMPDEDDLRNLVNSKRNAKARGKAQSEAFSANGIKAPNLEDVDFQIATMAKVFLAVAQNAGEPISKEDAQAKARAALGL